MKYDNFLPFEKINYFMYFIFYIIFNFHDFFYPYKFRSLKLEFMHQINHNHNKLILLLLK